MVERITTHQDQVKKRLKDLEEAEEIEDVTVGIRDTSISATDSMDVDNGEPPKPKPIRAKQRALNCYVSPLRPLTISRIYYTPPFLLSHLFLILFSRCNNPPTTCGASDLTDIV